MEKKEKILGNVLEELEEIRKLDSPEDAKESVFSSGQGVFTLGCCK